MGASLVPRSWSGASTSCLKSDAERADRAIVQAVRSERTLQAFLFGLVAMPGIGAAVVLLMSSIYSPSAIAAQEHLGPFARAMPACGGCGLCGMSRAFSAISHGELQSAIDFNPGVLIVWPLMWVLLAVSIFGVYRLWRHPVRFLAPPILPSEVTLPSSLSTPRASAL